MTGIEFLPCGRRACRVSSHPTRTTASRPPSAAPEVSQQAPVTVSLRDPGRVET